MEIKKKIQAVLDIFQELDTEIAYFQTQSQLQCRSYCHLCCQYEHIESTILEVLPLAQFLYEQGDWEKYLRVQKNSICPLLYIGNDSWGCCAYPYRSLVCRLFGFATRQDKFGKPEIVTCRWMKEHSVTQWAQIEAEIASGHLCIPSMNRYAWQLYGIDIQLGSKFYPITYAIQQAIELIGSDNDYHNPSRKTG